MTESQPRTVLSACCVLTVRDEIDGVPDPQDAKVGLVVDPLRQSHVANPWSSPPDGEDWDVPRYL